MTLCESVEMLSSWGGRCHVVFFIGEATVGHLIFLQIKTEVPEAVVLQ